MSTITVTNIKATGETASRSATGVAASFNHIDTSFNIAKSFNISSCTDESGSAPNTWTMTMTSAMDSSNYIVSGNCDDNANRLNAVIYTSSSAYKCHVYVAHSSGSNTSNIAHGVVHGDLA